MNKSGTLTDPNNYYKSNRFWWEAQSVIIGAVDSMSSLPDISSCVDEGPDTQTIDFIDGKTTFRFVGRFFYCFLCVCVCVCLYYTYYNPFLLFFFFSFLFAFIHSVIFNSYAHFAFRNGVANCPSLFLVCNFSYFPLFRARIHQTAYVKCHSAVDVYFVFHFICEFADCS